MESSGRPDHTSVSASHADDHCARCGGLMVVEHYMDLQDDTGQIGMTALRCTNCGDVIDAVILENRIRPAPNLLYGAKQRKYARRVIESKSDRSGGQTGNGGDAGSGS